MKVFECDDVVMMLSLVGFVGLGPDDESQRRRLWEKVAGRVVQLETAVQELAQNYYHAQIKVVRGYREQLNRTSHLQLLVRHGFKLGFLSELKSDHPAAYKSYTAAYQLLLDMRVTEHSASEVCTVAGLLSYKICRLAYMSTQHKKSKCHEITF